MASQAGGEEMAAEGGAPPAVVKVRWKPNEEQLRTLVRLFEQEGDSINKQRIKDITSDLARQGDVTEANVHNWFHNRKARAKRKQRLMGGDCGGEDAAATAAATSAASAAEMLDSSAHKRWRTELPLAVVVPNGVAAAAAAAAAAATAAFSDGVGTPRPALALPSDVVKLNSMYDASIASNPSLRVSDDANALGRYRHSCVPEQQHQEKPEEKHQQNQGQDQGQKQEQDQDQEHRQGLERCMKPASSATSESKTITDDGSERPEVSSDSRSWRRKGKGTMKVMRICSSSTSNSRRIRARMREAVDKLNISSRRELRALFAEVVRRLGTSEATNYLSRLTSNLGSHSPSSSSSTASPPVLARQLLALRVDHTQNQQHSSDGGGEHDNLSSSSSPDEDGGGGGGGSREDYRIVWSSKKRQFSSSSSPSREDIFAVQSQHQREHDSHEKQVQDSQQQQQAYQQERQQEQRESDKTSILVQDGKPSGAAASWWNSVLRHSASLFLDISIPHIALQPEEGLARVREYLNSKFSYLGGSVDDGYLKKQVAKSLNFRRHKLMRIIEQGAGRPNDVTEQQWDALVRYYADPKRREKSDKQRAALRALNLSNQQQQLQQIQQQRINAAMLANCEQQC